MPQVRQVGALDAAGRALVITQPMPPLHRGTVRALVTHRFPLARIAEAVTAHIEAPDAALGTLLLIEY